MKVKGEKGGVKIKLKIQLILQQVKVKIQLINQLELEI